MSARRSGRAEMALLRLWHAWISGAFVVAYLTADEDTYALHLFAGYAVLAAVAGRVLAGLAAPRQGPLSLPRPSLGGLFARRHGRHPLFAILASALLVVVGATAATGAAADFLTWMEHPHEAVAELSLWVIVAHVAFVVFMYGGRRRLGALFSRIFRSEVSR